MSAAPPPRRLMRTEVDPAVATAAILFGSNLPGRRMTIRAPRDRSRSFRLVRLTSAHQRAPAMKSKLRFILCTGLTTLAACEGAASPSRGDVGGGAVRDSAGIAIVESRSSVLPDGAVEVAETPALILGAPGNISRVAFHRIEGIVLVDHGRSARIVVAEGGNRRLRIFSLTGDSVAVFGRGGEGPGEFRALAGLLLAPPDTLVAFDPALERVTMFSIEDGYLGTLNLVRPDPLLAGEGHSVGGASRLMGRSGNGAVFAEPFEQIDQRISGLWEASWLLMRWNPEGSNPQPAGRYFSVEWFLGWEGSTSVIMRRAFGRTGVVRVTDDAVLATDGTFAGFRRYSLDGDFIGVVRAAVSEEPVQKSDRTRWREERLSPERDLARPRNRLRVALIEAMPFPETWPAVDRMMVDACGVVWLREGHGPEDRRWLLFHPENHRWLTTVTLSENLDPAFIGRRYLAAIERSELDEEYVKVYEIRRPAPCP